MAEPTVRKAPLVWWAGGLLLGLTMLFAIAVNKPLGVSTQFVVADGILIHEVAPEYARDHALISDTKYQAEGIGYSWWLDVGLIVGAALAAIGVRRWKFRVTTQWWRANNRGGVIGRFLFGFLGGFLILLGSRIGHGCTSGQFASGWTQLSLSVVPFTLGLFGFGVLFARIIYPKSPKIER
ncbi:MAG: YeeE/YedE thiosulfate transporter family protein [Phycisphaerae bacterium]